MPELSIVVPLLNETAIVHELIGMLGRQQDVAFELLLVDGGSTDGTPDLVAAAAREQAFPVRLLEVPRGLARQLNAGAAAAASAVHLFLHADSGFENPLALRRALDCLAAEKGAEVGGRFALRFRQRRPADEWGFYFYESKARLDRPECIHGDQGLMLPRQLLQRLGGFDESVPFAVETRLADRLRRQGGRWLLFPDEIRTSARRFEVEGLRERQTLNALIMNFAALGWDEFFCRARNVYRLQGDAGRLDLYPYFELIDTLQQEDSWLGRLGRWYRTGCYVRSHAWQLPFAWDARSHFRAGLPPGTGDCRWLRLHDRWFERCTANPPGCLLAALLTWAWFRLSKIRLSLSK